MKDARFYTILSFAEPNDDLKPDHPDNKQSIMTFSGQNEDTVVMHSSESSQNSQQIIDENGECTVLSDDFRSLKSTPVKDKDLKNSERQMAQRRRSGKGSQKTRRGIQGADLILPHDASTLEPHPVS